MKSDKENPLLGHVFRIYLIRCGILTLFVFLLVWVLNTAVFPFFRDRIENWWYYYRSAYLFLGATVVWGIGLVILTYQLLRQVVSYVDELKTATTQMFDKQVETISLSPELGDIANKINALRQEAEKNESLVRSSEQKKNELIMYLAHDLKTPLSSTIGYLNLLRQEEGLSEPVRRDYLEIAAGKAERLDALLNEFFEITQYNLSAITLQYSRINLTMMLEQMVFELTPLLLDKKLQCRVQMEDAVMLRCDGDKLQRVFDNLLKNAIAYSFPNSILEIQGTCREKMVFITFQNSGETIPEDVLSRIFEPFFRMDASRSSTGGAGLGLAIAKQIVQLHGGTIGAASRDDTITFTVALPLS